MSFTHEPNVQRSRHSSDPKTGTMYVDNEVRSAVALEFFRMEQHHSRMREEALAPLDSAATQSEPMDDQKLA